MSSGIIIRLALRCRPSFLTSTEIVRLWASRLPGPNCFWLLFVIMLHRPVVVKTLVLQRRLPTLENRCRPRSRSRPIALTANFLGRQAPSQNSESPSGLTGSPTRDTSFIRIDLGAVEIVVVLGTFKTVSTTDRSMVRMRGSTGSNYRVTGNTGSLRQVASRTVTLQLFQGVNCITGVRNSNDPRLVDAKTSPYY